MSQYWAVVHIVERKPIWVEGPYPSRNEARETAAMLRRDEPRTEDGRDLPVTYSVVGGSRLMSPRKMRQFMATWTKAPLTQASQRLEESLG